MQPLIAIGFWNDGGDGCSLHNPQEFVDSRRDDLLCESIFHYLRSGRIVNSYLGYSWCRFGCGIDESEMGSADLSDGVWLWPEGLVHYVARHDLRLPDEFIDHARANEFRAPEVDLVEETVESLDYWARWCAANTNGDPEAVAMWRRTPDEIEAADQEVIAGLLEKHGGLGEATCLWAGCENQALRGLVFCPTCAHNKMNTWS